MTSAVSTADAPGSTVTGTPASSAAATSLAPGSLTPGRPASVTSATRSPALRRGMDLRRALCFVVLVEAREARGHAMPSQEEDARAPRVLAQDEIGLCELAQDA